MPKELKIGGHIWKVELKELDNKLADTVWEKQTIYIDTSLSKDYQDSALIHELFHTCNSTLGDTDMGHALIDSLAEQMYQVLADNNLLAIN